MLFSFSFIKIVDDCYNFYMHYASIKVYSFTERLPVYNTFIQNCGKCRQLQVTKRESTLVPK